MSFKIYIEGGGDGAALDGVFREGWSSFFGHALGSMPKPKVVRGGSRSQTIDRFLTALRTSPPNTIPLLLVDSEVSVKTAESPWGHLANQQPSLGESTPPTGSVFLMVQLMETWFLADRDALRSYFAPNFNEDKLEAWRDLEAVPKKNVLEALAKATLDCSKRYAKGKLSFELLGKIDPKKVESACPHAKQLFERLRNP